MRVHLFYGFRGRRTNEVFLPPGEHNLTDDLAAYLVEIGHARFVEAPADPATVDDEVAVETVDYASLSVEDLTELAESRGLEVVGTGTRGKVLKADLIRALEQDAHA